MGIESYLLIAACYGLGCFLSHRLGIKQGTEYTLKETVKIIAVLSGETPHQIACRILEYRKAKALKS